MTNIEVCCDGMRTMIADGTIQPFTALGHETAQVYVQSTKFSLPLPSPPVDEVHDNDHFKFRPSFLKSPELAWTS
jgi:hypothetical protein